MPAMTKPADALQRLRRVHEETVVGMLRSYGALSRTDLMRLTGLSRTTLFAIISEMIERGAAVETEAAVTGARGRGRPASLVALNPSAGLLLGIDLGRRRVRVAVANVAHEVVATAMADVPVDAGVAEQADAAADLVRRLCLERGIRLDALDAVGVGVVGVVDGAEKEAAGAVPRATPAVYLPVTERLEREFGVRIAIDNNARLAALAESTWGPRGRSPTSSTCAGPSASAVGSSSAGGSCAARTPRPASWATCRSTPTGRRVTAAAAAAWRGASGTRACWTPRRHAA